MKLADDQNLGYSKISSVLDKFSIKERGNLKVVIELGPGLFSDLLTEQCAQRVFQPGGIMTEYKDGKLIVSGRCPCEIKKSYHLDNREVNFKVIRYVNEYMDIKYEDL